MNAVAKRSPSMLSPPVPKVIPDRLAPVMETDWSLGPHPAAIQAQAREWLEILEPFGAPATEPLIRAWTLPIGASVGNPRSREEATAWLSALFIALHGVPAGAFTDASQRELLRACDYWPSTAKVYEVVRPHAAAILRDIAALRRVIAAPTKREVA